MWLSNLACRCENKQCVLHMQADEKLRLLLRLLLQEALLGQAHKAVQTATLVAGSTS